MSKITVQTNAYGTHEIDLEFVNSDDEIMEVVAESADLDEDGADYLALLDTGYIVTDAEDLAEVFFDSTRNHFDLDQYIEARDSGMDEDVIRDYVDWAGSFDKDNCEESYEGDFDSPADFAENLVTEIYDLGDVPEFVKSNIDWDGVADDLRHDYYFADSGNVFRNI